MPARRCALGKSVCNEGQAHLMTDRNSLVSPVLLPWSHTARKQQERAASSSHIWKQAVNDT
jgi:hypothetical protein